MANSKIKRFKDVLRCVSCYSQLQEFEGRFACKNCNAVYKVVNNKSVVFIVDEVELNSNKIERPTFDYDYGKYEQMILNEHPGEIIIEIGSGINTCKDRKYENAILLEIFPYATTDVVCYAENLPFIDNSISGVICNAVLEHIKDPFHVVKEFYRILKPGGHLKIDVNFLYPYHSSPDHYFNMTISGVKELCKDFSPIEVGVGEHQLPCFGLHEILNYYFCGIEDPKMARKIKKMSVKKFMDFLQDCKNNYAETHLNSKAIENIAAGVFFYGEK